MKILKIELENLNSLRGQWTINLSDEIYESNGIFAITGPTGAGKTTIFDAVCLALYGQTPRLGKISENKNEIMSRRTHKCHAKVLFEIDGEKFISYWEQHRAGKSNKLQSAKHILSKADTGKIITDSLKDTPGKVGELIGFDFKRFRQAVMLEQGGFDSFLKADKNDRAAILESLTGTEIYSEISQNIYQRAQKEKLELENIKFQRENKRPSDDFQSVEEINEAIDEAKKNLERATREQENAKLSLEWLKNIRKLEKDLADNAHEISQLEKRFEIFTADSKRLEAGQRAAELSGDFSKLRASRENHGRLKLNAERLKREISNEAAIISKIETQDIPAINQEIGIMKRNFLPNESPESFCGAAKERVKIFRVIASRQNEMKKAKQEAETAFKQAQYKLKIAQKNQAAAQAVHDGDERKLNELIDMRKEAFFDLARQELKPGLPCPLCGSREHPALRDYQAKIKDVFRFDDAMKIARTKFEKSRQDLDTANKNEKCAKSEDDRARIKLDNIILESSKIEHEHSQGKLEILELLDKLGVSADMVGQLEPRIDEWLRNLKSLEENLQRSNEKINSCRARIETKENSLAQANSEIENSQSELESLEKNFETKLREKNFESEKIFTASIIAPEEIRKLILRKQELENDKSRLAGLKENFEGKLEREKSKNLTPKNFDELDAEFRAREKLINDVNKKIISLERDLDGRKKLMKELAKLEKDYARQEKIFSDWTALSNLIGSAHGDKFRIFAQNITLSMMINLANEQLEKMNGRYILLSRPDSENLELSVIDKEQAGEIRPTENLSGGERFIISLALALGLSGLSGNKSRIESLFLDEGFGSLDDEALNTALEALGELRNRGRMIGIISHVQALRERIAAQIEVIHKSDGVSVIKGPGVSLNFGTSSESS